MSQVDSLLREPLINGLDKTYGKITDDIVRNTEGNPPKDWWIAFGFALAGLLLYVIAVSWTIFKGIGVWGLQKTVNWAWDITNFVWWVGIGHAGTLISAVLLLFKQKWRTGINRAAEAMTIFAVICAGQFPLIHMGRIWQ
jgi:Ni/Fe-hydrogenase subunit HybB-like protein